MALYLGSSEKLKINLPSTKEMWKTVLEQTLTTSDSSSLNGYWDNFNTYGIDTPFFVEGDKIRLTINGQSYIETAYKSSVNGRYGIGNDWLSEFTTNTNYTDDGKDYCIETEGSGFLSSPSRFCFRYPSTVCNIKIEKWSTVLVGVPADNSRLLYWDVGDDGLLSSDGYILTDINGIYLTMKEEE